MYHKGSIENNPLQIYVTALLFSPTRSLIGKLFKHEEPKYIKISPEIGEKWRYCLQTLEDHSDAVVSVVFSYDSNLLASASWDKVVKLWDTSSGECLQTLKGHSRSIYSATFSHDSTLLASASWDKTVKLWDTSMVNVFKHLKATVVASIPLPSPTTRNGWRRRHRIRQLSSGIQKVTSVFKRSKVTTIEFTQ